MHFTWVSPPCNAKNTVNTTVFDSMDGGGVEPTTSGLQAARGGVNSDSIRKSAGPAPGIFLAKARGTPASIASFRDYSPNMSKLIHKIQRGSIFARFHLQANSTCVVRTADQESFADKILCIFSVSLIFEPKEGHEKAEKKYVNCLRFSHIAAPSPKNASSS